MSFILLLIFLGITFIIILFIKFVYKKDTTEVMTSMCWIDDKDYPEAKKIFEKKDIIIKELENILNSNKWSVWSNDYKTTPIFTKMTDEEIIKRIRENTGKINSTKEPSWRLFGLILNNNLLENASMCPETVKILKESSTRILNA